MSSTVASETVLEAISASLRQAAHYNRGTMVAPAAVLWPDEARQWEPLVPLLRKLHPALLTLGGYASDQLTGPAIWMRCLLARKLEAAEWPEGVVPVLYLPGVSRQTLSAVESCPRELQPLAELQYRGVFWSRQNARDWTVTAFLKGKTGLGLDVAQDQATFEALRRALPMLADTPVASLRGRRLEASDFDALLSPDPPRDLLRWLDSPAEARRQWTPERWAAFRSICRESYGFDPESEGELTGVERLAEQKGPWKAVWTRFVEAPRSYPGIPRLLEQAPSDILPLDPSCWPRVNAEDENRLRAALGRLTELAPHEAATKLADLEKEHRVRRGWVWAELGKAPLAKALEHLATLAQVSASASPGATPEAMTASYAETGWQADAAILRALAVASHGEDLAAVKIAVRTVYLPWVEKTAHLLQKLVRTLGFPGYGESAPSDVEAVPGEVIFFADGLRYDVGRLLCAELGRRSLEVELTTRWTGLPPVTPTCKPAVSPAAGLIAGKDYNEDFRPQVAATGKPLTADRFRALLGEAGYQFLRAEDLGDPSGKAWTEHGDLDRMGHDQGWKLARRIEEQVTELAERAEALLDAGWTSVRVVTDHGWLLLPGGLPKTDLPKYLVDTRWGRCAVLKSTADVDVQVVDWRWSNAVRIAVAPGVSCFKAGLEYAHGGLSLQECLTPELRVRRAASEATVAIDEVTWRGLRCRIKVSGTWPGLRADVRLKPAAPETSIADDGKPVSDNGSASLLIPDDDYLDHAAVVVVVATDGKVLAKKATSVGEGD